MLARPHDFMEYVREDVAFSEVADSFLSRLNESTILELALLGKHGQETSHSSELACVAWASPGARLSILARPHHLVDVVRADLLPQVRTHTS